MAGKKVGILATGCRRYNYIYSCSGAWSDGHEFWSRVSGEVKKEMGLHYMHDGEFWMEFFVDFCREFEVDCFAKMPEKLVN